MIASGTSCRSSGQRAVSPIRSTFGTPEPYSQRAALRLGSEAVGDVLTALRTRLAEISDLARAAGVLGWDQRVTMPPRGTEARAEQLSTLGRIAHERFVDAEVGRLLDAAEPLVEQLEYDSEDRSLVR